MNLRKVILCDEMIKLRNRLTRMGIPWIDRSHIVTDDELEKLHSLGFPPEFIDTTIYRTNFEYAGIRFSVINGFSTWGGYSPSRDLNEGTLEVLRCDTEEIDGGFTADEVIKLLNSITKR